MAVAAQAAMRAWVNGKAITMTDGQVLGAYLREQRSPADGPYAVLQRNPEGVGTVVAEDEGAVTRARIQCLVYAGTQESAEHAAAALRTAFEGLRGCPEPCGTTGVTVLVADLLNGPFELPVPPDQGEIFCFQVGADFLLMEA